MKIFFLLLAGLLVFFAASNAALAQSDNRDNPIPLRSNEITGNLNEHNEEHFYSFIAGPGELIITVDVKAKSSDQGLLNFELLEKNAATSLICCEFAQGNDGGTGRDVKSVRLTKRQTVILHTTNGPIGGGTFRLRLSGAGLSDSNSAKTSENSQIGENNRSERNSSSNRINIPTSGTLRIRMKDGSTKEIDLSLIREISVKP